VLYRAYRRYRARFDPVDGGMTGAPKFPSALPVRLLLHVRQRFDEPEAVQMASLTLNRMAAGGIHDQIGGGFHRYSTDDHWQTPHFEKMLYDNALQVLNYLAGYQATGQAAYAHIAADILDYIRRDMTAPGGGFYSAIDADSPGPDGRRREGRFYTWTPDEIRAAAGRQAGELLIAYFGVTEEGDVDGRSTLHIVKSFPELAAGFGLSGQQVRDLLERGKRAMWKARTRRLPPARDDKVLTAWNGLMISAFARAARVMHDPGYLEQAERAAAFIMQHMRDEGRLLRSYNGGTAHIEAYLDDYTFMIQALLDLYEAGGQLHWFVDALSLDRVLGSDFEDHEHGGFFRTGQHHETLLAREKPGVDTVIPSGNSVAVRNLLRLYELTTDERYRRRATAILQFFSKTLSNSPTSLPEMLLGLDFYSGTPSEIVIITPHSRAEARPFLDRLADSYLPNHVLTVVTDGQQVREHQHYVPIVEGKRAIDGKATAYVCRQWVCQLPTTDPAVFTKLLSAPSDRQ